MSSNGSDLSGAAGLGPHSEPLRVLLVSDDAEERALVRTLLDEAGRARMPLGDISLDTAGDYRQATILAADFDYVAVLLGRVGPAQDGTALLRRVVAEGTLPAPFLVLGERIEPPAVQAAIAAGAADMLEKRGLTAVALERALRYAVTLHKAENRASGLELFDPATGLARQPLFWEVLSLAVRRAKRNKDFLAVLMLHVDCLEQPTGRPGVDPLAAAMPLIARRVVHALRASDSVARLDDGHVAVLVESMPRAVDIQTVAEKIIASVAGRYETDGRIFSVSVNVGIALCPTTADDAGVLLRSAAAATLVAREKGVDTFHFG